MDSIICPRCGVLPVDDDVVAGRWHWHAGHFSCATCRRNLCNNAYEYGPDGLPYCLFHYTENFAYDCIACGKATMEHSRTILDGFCYHNECLTCSICTNQIDNVTSVHRWGVRIVCSKCFASLPPSLSAVLIKRQVNATDNIRKRIRNLKAK